MDVLVGHQHGLQTLGPVTRSRPAVIVRVRRFGRVVSIAVLSFVGCASSPNGEATTPAVSARGDNAEAELRERSQKAYDRLAQLWNVSTPDSPDQVTCPDLRIATAEACDVGFEACVELPQHCSSAARLCRTGIRVTFDYCTAGYVGDRVCKSATCTEPAAPLLSAMPFIKPYMVSTFRVACEGDDFDMCAFLGWLHDRGIGVPRDGEQRLTFLNKACAGRSGEGCYELGMAYYLGRDAVRNPARAVQLFETACQLEAKLCSALAAAHVDGIGVDQSYSLGDHFLSKACRGGNAPACRQRDCLNELVAGAPRMANLVLCGQGEPD